MDIFRKIWKIKDLRNSVIFVVLMLVVFRAVAHIPVPGVNSENLATFLSNNQFLGLLNVFSGGTIQNFSIAMLGVAPYITASIIFQLLNMVIPYFEELSKEGEQGQAKISMYTRISSVPLALLQAFGLIKLLSSSGVAVFDTLTTFAFVSIMLTVTAGTVFLMWIGEIITEKKIGNGISLLIFAGIVAALPGVVQNLAINYNPADFYTYLLFALVAVITIVGVVYISEGQRMIPVNYARSAQGGRSARVTSHLPLRVNMAGVIPIIFAISLVLFPSMIAQFFINSPGAVGSIAQTVVELFANQLFYGAVYFILVFGFTYFYTAVIFQPQKMAENLQRQGAFVPGIRPGKQTEEYLSRIMTRLVFSGALFLAAIAILPLILQAVTGMQSLALGGTGLLIVVSVAVDIAKQIEAQLTMHQYDKA